MNAAKLLTAASLCSLAVSCVNELNPHLREDHADHTVAFVGQDDELNLVREGDYMVGELVERGADEPFNRVAIRFDALGDVMAEIRVRDQSGIMTEWAPLEETYYDEGAHNAHADVQDGANAFQLRFTLEAPVTFLAAEAMVFEPSDLDGDMLNLDADEPSETLQGLAADGLVVTRSQWGARSRSCGPRHTPNRLTIHHTVTPNNDSMSMPARMRQIQNFHINSNGWCDIGYHFLIGQDGKVYQGRVENILGAHAANANTNNVGISFIGTFTSVTPSDAMLNAAARIMKSMSRTYNITLNRDKVKGHRQVGSTATSCPGQRLYDRLSNLIDRAKGTTTGGSTGGSSGGSSGGTTTNTCPKVKITASTLNVRPDPNTNRAPVGTLSSPEKVTRTSTTQGQSVNGNKNWYRIQKGSMSGYISAAYATCSQ